MKIIDDDSKKRKEKVVFTKVTCKTSNARKSNAKRSKQTIILLAAGAAVGTAFFCVVVDFRNLPVPYVDY